MSETTEPTVTPRAHEDRIVPALVYLLYLLTPMNGVSVFIGLLVAYFGKGDATPKAESHYVFLIRTFWLSIGWALIGGLMILVGIPLSFVLIGIPIVMVGWVIICSIGLWFMARGLVGAYYLLKDEPYPRPRSWLF